MLKEINSEIERLINIDNCRTTKALELLPVKIDISKGKKESFTYKSIITLSICINNTYVPVYDKVICARSIRILKAKIKLWLLQQTKNVFNKLEIT